MSRYVSIFGLTILTLTPFLVATAQVQYVPIAQIPFAPSGAAMTAEQFVQSAYRLAIVVAAMLAVIKIIYGGVQWMLTDVITSKESAKKDIWGAILGLIIVLSAVFILEIVNPQLKTFTLFRGAPVIDIAAPAQSSALAPAGGGANGTPSENCIPGGLSDGGGTC